MGSAPLQSSKYRIGLALSGGGFRASLFHLGVIRRLEELGIMEHVAIVSSVSGGSIIAAFYLCEMEKHLREFRMKGTTPDRLALFENISEKFLEALDHNLRTRALVFSPWYHPFYFLKTLVSRVFRAGARAELIQAEYDRFFYFKDTLDQLPVEKPSKIGAHPAPACVKEDNRAIFGPRLLLNTTSLLSGERRTFSRDANSGIKDLKTSNTSVLRLSRVVGASSGVPVLFPPTAICGDLLVDGGISDNQGIEGLLDPENACNVILVSDASGQLQVEHSLSTSAPSVYARISGIFQFQIRNKLLELLLAWSKVPAPQPQPQRCFAFIHLLLNLKGRRGSPPHVSTDFLPAIAGLRTDLDQFSRIECESLMYHGYTLIDAQLREYCCEFLQEICPDFRARRLKTPPLFQPSVQEKLLQETVGTGKKDHNPIREDLTAGSQGLYLVRCLKKYPWQIAPVLLVGLLAGAGLVAALLGPWNQALKLIRHLVENSLFALVPSWLVAPLGRFLAHLGFVSLNTVVGGVANLAALLIIVALALYLAAFPVYEAVRRLAMRLDLRTYRRITKGKPPSVHWPDPDPPTEVES